MEQLGSHVTELREI